MRPIDRYSLKFNHGQVGLFPVSDGEFVRYEDHQARVQELEAQLAAQTTELRRLSRGLEQELG